MPLHIVLSSIRLENEHRNTLIGINAGNPKDGSCTRIHIISVKPGKEEVTAKLGNR